MREGVREEGSTFSLLLIACTNFSVKTKNR